MIKEMTNLIHSSLLTGLTIYRAVTNNDIISTWQELMDSLRESDPNLILPAYHRFYAMAMTLGWSGILVNLILDDDNIFARTAATQGARVSPSLKELAIRDLRILQEVAALTLQGIKERCIPLFRETVNSWNLPQEHPLAPANWPEWNTETNLTTAPACTANLSFAARWLLDTRHNIMEHMFNNPWASCADILTAFYSKVGYGIFGQFAAAYWQNDTKEFGLVGIANPDPIRLDQLIGLDSEKKIVVENTEYFLAGLPANNMILYGSRGTGKSSMVKALLHDYVDQGLRLVEIAKSDLPDFPLIYRILADEPAKFILFIDDLSFDDNELDYKTLKTMLEGGISTRPSNVLIYATSNRRHLIKETYADRQTDVHSQDGQEEKLSLADRFGITVTFLSPDQVGYLQIVEALAIQNHLQINHEELCQQALRWEMWHNGRSGRTARQFIDHLIAQQAVKLK